MNLLFEDEVIFSAADFLPAADIDEVKVWNELVHKRDLNGTQVRLADASVPHQTMNVWHG